MQEIVNAFCGKRTVSVDNRDSVIKEMYYFIFENKWGVVVDEEEFINVTPYDTKRRKEKEFSVSHLVKYNQSEKLHARNILVKKLYKYAKSQEFIEINGKRYKKEGLKLVLCE